MSIFTEIFFAERLNEICKAEKLTSKDLAGLLDIKPSTFQRYTSGSTMPSAEVFAGLHHKLGINLSWFVTGEGQMYRSSVPVNTAPTSDDATVASLQTWVQHYAQTRTAREVQWLEVEISRRFPDYNRWLIEQGREPVSKPTLFDSLVGSLMRPLSPDQTRQLVELAESMEKENSQQKP